MVPYSISKGTLSLATRILVDTVRVSILGLPALPGRTPQKIAANVIRQNYRDGILWVGSGHFHFMWTNDFAISLRGAETVLTTIQIRRAIEHMIIASRRLGYVPTSYTSSYGFDAPTRRGDSFPSLLYAVWEYTRWSRDTSLIKEHRNTLQTFLDHYEASSFGPDGLIRLNIMRDWVDTINRPSSTWNNIWALKILTIAPRLGLKTKQSPRSLAQKILTSRWKNNHLVDHGRTDQPSTDGALLAIYFDLFDKTVQRNIMKQLEKQRELSPIPLRANAYIHSNEFIPFLTTITTSHYHDTVIWPFLGFMYVNARKKLGLEYKKDLAIMETMMMKFHNTPETLRPDGKGIYLNVLSTESGFTMTAGQYLEVLGDKRVK